jgi:hypothetical protein
MFCFCCTRTDRKRGHAMMMLLLNPVSQLILGLEPDDCKEVIPQLAPNQIAVALYHAGPG